MKPPVLPVYHYLDHFTEMLSFVKATYSSVLTDEHRAFVSPAWATAIMVLRCPTGAATNSIMADPRCEELPPKGLRTRDLYIPDLHVDSIKVKTRDFR